MVCKLVQYECCRCGYQSNRKSNISTHLYKNKTICKGSFNDIELTDFIKEKIINNGRYIIPKATPQEESLRQSFTQIINNNNVINNYISGLDDVTKIKKHCEYHDIQLTPLSTMIEDANERRVDQFKRGVGNPSLCMTKDCFLQSIESIVKIKNLEEISVLFTKSNLIKIYDGDWASQRIIPGIKIILLDFQEYLWNYYEIYLIRNIINKDNKAQEIARYKEYLESYYHFICCIGLSPFVDGRNKFNIIYDISDDEYDETPSDSDMEFTEYYVNMYSKIKMKIKTSEINKTYKDVIQLMKENYKANIEKVNCAILSLIELDKEYKLKYINKL